MLQGTPARGRGLWPEHPRRWWRLCPGGQQAASRHGPGPWSERVAAAGYRWHVGQKPGQGGDGAWARRKLLEEKISGPGETGSSPPGLGGDAGPANASFPWLLLQVRPPPFPRWDGDRDPRQAGG